MNWKEVLLGSISTLVVTVVGGIGVYYYTKEPDIKKSESIVYYVNKSANFKGQQEEIAFSSIRVLNKGGVSAKNISIQLSTKDAFIKDMSIDSDSKIQETSRSIDAHSVKLLLSTLLPNEEVSVNVLLSKGESPSINVRSDSSLGVNGFETPIESSAKEKINKASILFVPLTGLLLSVVLTFTIIRLKRQGLMFSTSQNNAGFLLMHNGLIDEALGIFNAAILKGQYDVLVLSNLALCKSIKGDNDAAKKLLRAANFTKVSGHPKAVVMFNDALISLLNGSIDDALVKLKKALELSPKEISSYCKNSVHWDSIRSQARFNDLLANYP